MSHSCCKIVMIGLLLFGSTAWSAATGTNTDEFTLGEVIVTGEHQVVNLATTVNEVSSTDLKHGERKRPLMP